MIFVSTNSNSKNKKIGNNSRSKTIISGWRISKNFRLKLMTFYNNMILDTLLPIFEEEENETLVKWPSHFLFKYAMMISIISYRKKQKHLCRKKKCFLSKIKQKLYCKKLITYLSIEFLKPPTAHDKKAFKRQRNIFYLFHEKNYIRIFHVTNTLKPFIPEKGKSPQKIILTENDELVINR